MFSYIPCFLSAFSLLSLCSSSFLQVDHHRNAKQFILQSIPANVVELGLVAVDATAIRNQLTDKHDTIIQSLLSLLKKHIATNGRKLLSTFEGMAKRLQSFPRNIEELSTLQEYCTTAPSTIEEMAELTTNLYSDFDCLESYSFQAPVLFNQRWEINQVKARKARERQRHLAPYSVLIPPPLFSVPQMK